MDSFKDIGSLEYFLQNDMQLTSDHSSTISNDQLSFLKEVIQLAEAQSPLTADKLEMCFQLCANAEHSSPDNNLSKIDDIQNFLTHMNDSFPKNPKFNTLEFVQYLGDQLYKFFQAHMFPKYNGGIGRIIVAYLLARAGYPIFKFDTKTACPLTFSEALKSKNQTYWYIAELIKSQIRGESGVLFKVKEHYEFSSEYIRTDGIPEQMTVHWHELNKAIKKWKEG